MNKKHNISSEESRLFRDSVNKMFINQEDNKENSENFEQIPAPQDSEIILRRLRPDEWVSAEDHLQFARNGISQRSLQKLKRGEHPIEGRLDLHQMTGNQALEATRNFLQKALQDGKRCLLIIHGKGNNDRYPGPILKNLISAWLREQSYVLAYISAQRPRGGTGAVWILLRLIPR